jgi:hypothetical protein
MNRKMKKSLIKVLVSFVVCLGLGHAIFGQNDLGVLDGSVLDQIGAVIPGAKVVLKGEGGKELRQIRTNDEGTYYFSGLTPGEYEIEVTVNWINKTFRKQVTVTSSRPSQSNVTLSLEPCSEDTVAGKEFPLTNADKAEIAREMIDLHFPKLYNRSNRNLPNPIFSNANLQIDWLNPEQKAAITVMSRIEIQEITEKSGEFIYYSISKMNQRGSCVTASMFENWTVKGQLQDANMAGGGTSYEFRKINGRWTGSDFLTWIS